MNTMSGPSPGTRHWGLRLSATDATGRNMMEYICQSVNLQRVET